MRAIVALPTVRVEIDGVPLSPRIAEGLSELRVQQKLSRPDQCELTFLDHATTVDSAAPFSLGASVRVTVDEQSEALFAGEITALEHSYGPARGHTLSVRAYDRLHRLRKRQPVRAHVQVSVQDLAAELVSDLGVSVAAESSGPFHPYLIQHSQSDFDLLVEVAEGAGLYPTLRGETLHLVTLEGIGEPLPVALGESLHEARVEINAEPACRLVSAAGWNPLQAAPYSSQASTPRSGREVAAWVDPGEVGGSGERRLVNEITVDAEHAAAIAQAELDCRVAREITLWAVADGDPRLRPGTRVSVSGIGESVSGQYVLTAVTHVVNQREGFLSELSSMPPPPRTRQRGVLAAMGKVTRVDDPEGRGRVRMALSGFGDVETPWMGVVSAGAGAGKGLVMLPDVGDEVLALVSPDDPAHGVVLGGLYGLDVKDPAARQYLIVTPGGQRVRLDDEQGAVRVENAGGSYVEMGPENVRMHASVDLQIEAPGRRVTIRGNAIEFERG